MKDKQIHIRISNELDKYIRKKGETSAYIRRLIIQDMKKSGDTQNLINEKFVEILELNKFLKKDLSLENIEVAVRHYIKVNMNKIKRCYSISEKEELKKELIKDLEDKFNYKLNLKSLNKIIEENEQN